MEIRVWRFQNYRDCGYTCNPHKFEIPALRFPRRVPVNPCKHLQCSALLHFLTTYITGFSLFVLPFLAVLSTGYLVLCYVFLLLTLQGFPCFVNNFFPVQFIDFPCYYKNSDLHEISCSYSHFFLLRLQGIPCLY